VLVGIAVAIGACAPPPGARRSQSPAAPPGSDRPYTGPFVDPATVPQDFLDRQRITATYGDRTAQFDAVLQKRGGELTLLGLTPFGSRAFVLRQVGTDVFFQSFVPQSMPFPPRYILIDVQRVFFAWAQGSAGGAVPDAGYDAGGSGAPPDGELQREREGEIETERWVAGRLQRRTFRRADGDPRGEIVVDYDGDGMGSDGTPPAHIRFANGWYGYRLEIATLSHQRL
jgi:hypothetical protein